MKLALDNQLKVHIHIPLAESVLTFIYKESIHNMSYKINLLVVCLEVIENVLAVSTLINVNGNNGSIKQ